MDCAVDRAAQSDRVRELQGAFDDHVEWLIASGVSGDKARDLAGNDPPGIMLDDALKCMGAMDADRMPHSGSPESYAADRILDHVVTAVIAATAAVIGAVFTIRRSEKGRIDNIRSASRGVIMESLKETGEILKRPREYTSMGADGGPAEAIPYVNQKISATPFESIINSGSFAYLSSETQRIVDTMHFRISEHNKIHSDLQDIIARSKMERLRPKSKEVILDLILGLFINEAKLKEHVAEFTSMLNS